ncbi:3330_t:CDS:1 [Ambispora leptoticha]|uniref:3330_t:CDS:1 n=1 Tax=Ambispora leptoticha TaxID=144679 RepID=A0A9N8WM79_9GLOM|nr:3330_t:CDS:1 [Ambispora leptoticha]
MIDTASKDPKVDDIQESLFKFTTTDESRFVQEILKIFISQHQQCRDDKEILQEMLNYIREIKYHEILLFLHIQEHRHNTNFHSLLAFMYYWGIGTAIDPKKSFLWYKKAAENGDALGQNELGACYGMGRGVKQNNDLAVHWYRKAAHGGSAMGQFNYGSCLAYGDGTPTDWDAADYWLNKSAENGCSNALDLLGYFYTTGKGVRIKDEWRGYLYFKRAAAAGHYGGHYNMAECYQKGVGVNRDLHQAIRMYRKSSNEGYIYAKYQLPCLFRIEY